MTGIDLLKSLEAMTPEELAKPMNLAVIVYHRRAEVRDDDGSCFDGKWQAFQAGRVDASGKAIVIYGEA